jgi:hypothetical protein
MDDTVYKLLHIATFFERGKLTLVLFFMFYVWRSGNTLPFHARGRGSTPVCRSDAPTRMIVFLVLARLL